MTKWKVVQSEKLKVLAGVTTHPEERVKFRKSVMKIAKNGYYFQNDLTVE